MSERSNNIRYFLEDETGFRTPIKDAKDFVDLGGDTYSLEEGGHFITERTATVTLFEDGYEYLLSKLLKEGPNSDIRFITEQKNDMTFEQEWVELSAPSVDMSTLKFLEQSDNKSVELELVQGNLLQRFEANFDNEFDVVAENVPELPYVNLRLDPRQIFRRSRLFVEDGTETKAVVSGGDNLNARAVPWKIEFSSDQQNIQFAIGDKLNAANGNYSNINDADKVGVPFYLNADRQTTIRLVGNVNLNMVNRNSGSFNMDLVYYKNGLELEYDDQRSFRISNLNPLGTTFQVPIDLELDIEIGDTIAIAFLSNTSDGISWTYFDTELEVLEESLFPTTYSKAVRPEDMFLHLSKIAMDRTDLQFLSSVFSQGQRHENKLLVHGSWLRNMPQVLNEGDEDERRLQAELSLKDLYEAYSILEPLRYDAQRVNGKDSVIIGSRKDILQNFTAIRLGETTDKFRLIEPNDKERNPIGDDYWGSVRLGSETSGSNYGQINNLYSICGRAKWPTVNRKSKEVYEYVTSFRTGAEDIELQRQFQYSDNPDIDGEYDNDWFLVDCELVGNEYRPKGWQAYYEEKPTGVYSADTNYNWVFAPVELLRGHGYQINEALYEQLGESLGTPVGNCTLSLITKRANETAIKASNPFPHSLLERPRQRLMSRSFSMVVGMEVISMLRGSTNGVDNKFGLIEHLWNGEKVKSRLVEVDTDGEAEFTLIEARL